MKKIPFRLTPYQVQWLLIVGFVTIGYALYLRYLAIELSTVALACDASLQTMLCKTRVLATSLFRNSVFGAVALGPFIGGLQAQGNGWRPLFWIVSAVSLMALILAVLTFEDAPPANPDSPLVCGST